MLPTFFVKWKVLFWRFFRHFYVKLKLQFWRTFPTLWWNNRCNFEGYLFDIFREIKVVIFTDFIDSFCEIKIANLTGHPVCASVSGGILCLKHLEDLYSRPLESNPETAIFWASTVFGNHSKSLIRQTFIFWVEKNWKIQIRHYKWTKVH